MRYRAFSAIFAGFLGCCAGKISAADDISPVDLLGKYGFSAMSATVLSACSRIEKPDLPRLNEAYRCWDDADHAFCTHLHERLALVVYTSEESCRAGRRAFGSKP